MICRLGLWSTSSFAVGWKADKAIIQKLMGLSSALTGKVTTLLTQAAELEIRQRTEYISAELIDQAAANGIYKLAPLDSEAQSL